MSDRATESYGESTLTLVDRAGVWLSQRAIRRHLPRRKDLKVLELGCGYRAVQLQGLSEYIAHGTGVDFTISPDLKTLPKFTFIEGSVEEALPTIQPDQFDVVLLISVLEHLENPFAVLTRCSDLLVSRGKLLINVPTWVGKRFLEFSAFRLGLSPRVEMDDHKMYYGARDLWPLLVGAGFRPSDIALRYHKLGLNLLAVAVRQ